ncbi:MAG: 16S rRNA (cytidine(1402)-2'-O)-methyltransferase [Bradymonadaceae bacterium]|nr:16S rRNA (cytidine(1402)-2'-O)-methyltransferase [Lujinxingiaceae bacterium]
MLIVCPTPIGNLSDITARQRDALSAAEIIACEDTRETGKLLERLGIVRVDGVPALVSYHEHNEQARVSSLVAALQQGKRVVLVSDAGTPAISDPGFRLVRAAVEAGLAITALPGPVAAMVALSASGLPTDRFFFEGFLPSKQGARRKRLSVLDALGVSVVLYESPHRVIVLLEDVVEVLGAQREVCVARELTKLHEEYLRGTADAVRSTLSARERVRGEFVVILGPRVDEDPAAAEEREEAIDSKILELLEEGMRPRGIKEVVSALFGLAKSEIYERIERIDQGRSKP